MTAVMAAHIISIVEDNKMCQMVLVKIINDKDEFLLGEIYESAEDALEMIENPPNVAIVDIELPGMNGIALIKKLKTTAPEIQCLVCTMHDDDEKIFEALESGADGYVLKKSTPAQIKRAICDVIEGGAPMSPYVAKRVISIFKKPVVTEKDALLTEREQQVIQLLSKGLSYKQIGDQLFVSHETVKKHLKNIYYKLHVQNKVEALNKWKLI